MFFGQKENCLKVRSFGYFFSGKNERKVKPVEEIESDVE